MCPLFCFHILVFIGIILLFVLVYIRAVSSRKYYRCPECNESFRVELMKATHCKVCGAVVNYTDDKNITDKA